MTTETHIQSFGPPVSLSDARLPCDIQHERDTTFAALDVVNLSTYNRSSKFPSCAGLASVNQGPTSQTLTVHSPIISDEGHVDADGSMDEPSYADEFAAQVRGLPHDRDTILDLTRVTFLSSLTIGSIKELADGLHGESKNLTILLAHKQPQDMLDMFELLPAPVRKFRIDSDDRAKAA